MRINERLNLVIPIEQDGRAIAYIHSMPISAEVFDTHSLVLAKTFSAIHAQGLGAIAGPRVAAKLLKRIALADGAWDEVERGLIAEVHRLTNVIHIGARGWEAMPYPDAVAHKVLDADDLDEAANAVVFFIVYSAMLPRARKHAVLEGAAEIWGALVTSQSYTDFIASLPTSNEAANSGVPSQEQPAAVTFSVTRHGAPRAA